MQWHTPFEGKKRERERENMRADDKREMRTEMAMNLEIELSFFLRIYTYDIYCVRQLDDVIRYISFRFPNHPCESVRAVSLSYIVYIIPNENGNSSSSPIYYFVLRLGEQASILTI